jgi:hypothetical protein
LYGLYEELESSRLCGTGLRSNPAKTSWHVVWTTFSYSDGQVLLGAWGGANGNTEKGAEFGQSVSFFIGNQLNPTFIGEK